MYKSSSKRKRSSKVSSTIKEKRQLLSSKPDEDSPRVGKCLKSPESKKMEAETDSNNKKEPQTIQMLMEKMKTTNEELEYRLEKSKGVNVIEKYSKFFKCTKCQKTYKPVLNKDKKFEVHPMLGVLMCVNCRNYYGDGDFSMDSDGEDKYCRWCGEGGMLFSCSKCICGFCDICIRRHFGNGFLKNVQKDDDWVCFICNPKPLWHLRFISSVAEQAANKTNEASEKKENSSKKTLRNSKIDESSSDETESDLTTPTKTQNKKPESRRVKIYTSSSDDSDEDTVGNSGKKLRFSNESGRDSPRGETESLNKVEIYQAVKNLENILKLTEYQMGLGLDWSKKKYNKLKTVNDKTPVDKLRKECQKMKWFISVISSYLVGFCNSIDAVEKSLGEEETGSLDTSTSCTNHLTYANIIQFLGFMTNQVKTFSEKGITLQDLLQAELYEDANVLGFKKNSLSNSSRGESKKSPPHSSELRGRENDDDNVTVDSNKNRNNEENCEVNSSSEDFSAEIGDNKTAEDQLSEPVSTVDEHKSGEEITGALEDFSSQQNPSATENYSPEDDQYKLNWRDSVNGEDVQDILTILESA